MLARYQCFGIICWGFFFLLTTAAFAEDQVFDLGNGAVLIKKAPNLWAFAANDEEVILWASRNLGVLPTKNRLDVLHIHAHGGFLTRKRDGTFGNPTATFAYSNGEGTSIETDDFFNHLKRHGVDFSKFRGIVLTVCKGNARHGEDMSSLAQMTADVTGLPVIASPGAVYFTHKPEKYVSVGGGNWKMIPNDSYVYATDLPANRPSWEAVLPSKTANRAVDPELQDMVQVYIKEHEKASKEGMIQNPKNPGTCQGSLIDVPH